MAIKDVNSLKRPDLQGKFTCGLCGQLFNHNASLNRHRRTKHNSEQTCLICHHTLGVGEDLHHHMNYNHGITKVFTCGCCNYTFNNKKYLYEHTKSMKETGQPGCFPFIAKTTNSPGSLLAHRPTAPYSLLQHRLGSLSPLNSSTTSTPPIMSEVSSERVSPKPTIQELADADSQKLHDQLFTTAITAILDSGIFFGNILTVPQTWVRIIELGKKIVAEEMEKKKAGQNI